MLKEKRSLNDKNSRKRFDRQYSDYCVRDNDRYSDWMPSLPLAEFVTGVRLA